MSVEAPSQIPGNEVEEEKHPALEKAEKIVHDKIKREKPKRIFKIVSSLKPHETLEEWERKV